MGHAVRARRQPSSRLFLGPANRAQVIGVMMIGIIVAPVTAFGAPDETTAEACEATPRQTEGPYYPPARQRENQDDRDNDLTEVRGQTGRASGQTMYVIGQVRDVHCRPLAGAVVEIWQASANGRYQHPDERDNPRPLDPAFQYWGMDRTGADGSYRFKTIKPGPYSTGRDRMRPSHIHFKIRHPSVDEFITQMYFVGDPHQDADRILNGIPAGERGLVIIAPRPADQAHDNEALFCKFDITVPLQPQPGKSRPGNR
ncbi:MAG: protocatechuate 3,4-dioxygenase [Nitrospiraceae bacterium]